MRKFTLLKTLFILAIVIGAGKTNAQIHPLAFGNANWYKNYVGILFNVTAPNTIAGAKQYTTSNDGSGGPAVWGGYVTTPIINIPIIMPPGIDTTVSTTTLVPGSMTGKIAFIYRGGSEYGHKAHQAEMAGAIACIIVNNIPGPPFGMGAGLEGGLVTIPVFMVSKADGDAMDIQYRSGATVRMTITPWKKGLNNDLGMVPQGIAGWLSYAIPHNQLFTTGSVPTAYNIASGAFIANFGNNPATNVTVTDTLSYTPVGFPKTQVHTSITSALTTFNTIDSIYAMLGSSEYSFTPSSPANGRFDLKYTIQSDSLDDYPADNSATYSFYTTDSVYSKGQYDFSKNVPVSSTYTAYSGAIDFMWGPTYYIAHGTSAISSVQFSLSAPSTGPLGLTSTNVYAFKWVDGSGGQPLDGYMQNGELNPVSLGVYNFSPSDTSGGVFKVQMGDPVTGIVGAAIVLDTNAWYYIAVEVPSGYYLGCDGQQSAYPRIYSRYHTSGTMEYSNVMWPGSYNSGSNPMTAQPAQAESPCAFPRTTYINSVDSFNYSGQKGLIPSVAMIVNNKPSTIFGTTTICAGTSTALSDTRTGGVWSSSNTSIATIVAGSGLLHGVAAGTATITYSSTPVATTVVTIEVLPVVPAITGTTLICGIGNLTNLFNTAPDGTWSSSAPAIANVDALGIVTGSTAGTATISYTLSNSCGSSYALTTVTVSPNPSAGIIAGPSSVCTGTSITLSDAVTGGSWNSSNPGVAFISSGGVVNGITTGTADISYAVTNICGTATTTAVMTVNTLPDAGTITGPGIVCLGNVIILSDAATGGAWTTANGNASVSTSGNVLGLTAGTDIISYTVTNSCGTQNATYAITIVYCPDKVNNITAGTNGVTAYPNPTNDIITISAPVIINTIVVTNVVGEKVFSGNYGTKNAAVDMKHLSAGVYTIKVNGSIILKVVKQ